MESLQGAANDFFRQSARFKLGLFVLQGLAILGFIRLFNRRDDVLQ